MSIGTNDDPIQYPLPANCDDVDSAQNTPPASAVVCTSFSAVTLDLGDRNDTGVTIGTADGVTWLGNTGADTLSGADGSQTLGGGAGDDSLAGNGGADVLSGGDGNDDLTGGDGDDSLNGGGGADALNGGAGADTLDSESGEDLLVGGTGSDTVRGGDGSDVLDASADGGADAYDGGGGIDLILHTASEPLTVDLTAGAAGSGTERDSVAAVEDVFTGGSVRATVLGDAATNSISTDGEADRVDPRGGNDIVSTRAGDDIVELRDGFADRVSCGDGADSVQADTLDTVSGDCETVTRTDVGNANDTAEDKVPTVTIGAPASSAVLSTVAPNTITAEASDDKGIAQVIFSTGERTLCVDTAAPYSCDYRPTSADVGRDTLVVIAVDTAQQTASAVRTVNVPRFKATSLSAATTPKRDWRAPYRFTTKGRLALPAGVAPESGCSGTVAVTFKAGKKTVSTRRVALTRTCTYSSRVTFRLPRRLRPKTLAVSVVYSGNAVLEGVRARRLNVRTR